jgi:hypothetical protein
MNMSIEFKKFYNKILLDMKTFEVTIDLILVYLIGSKLRLYVSFLIRLYFLGRFSILYKCQNYPCMKYQIGMSIALACMALEVGHVGKHI